MAILSGGAVTIGGDMADDLRQKVSGIITQFEDVVGQQAMAKRLRRAVVRSQFVCNAVLLLDRSHLWIIAEPARGLPALFSIERPDGTGGPASCSGSP